MLVFLFSVFGFFFICWGWVDLLCVSVVTLFFLLGMFPLNFFFFSSVFSYTDTLGFSLQVLSVYVFMLMLLASISSYKKKNYSYFYNFLLSVLLLSLLFSFCSSNMLMFYFFFESSLVPTFMLIFGWGVQPERVQASVYFFFYTLFMSLPLLVVMVYLYRVTGSYCYFLAFDFRLFSSLSVLFGIFVSLSFFIKLPVFFFHLWLPKAHVEAPVSGSMVLAAVLLKLGGYGLFRFYCYIVPMLTCLGGYIFSLGLVSTVFVGFFCCRISDMKSLIAYSSVAHMGLFVCVIVSNFSVGFNGCVMLMISHGMTSSGLFSVVNFFYERLGSRSVFVSSGLLKVFPVVSFFLFMLCSSNFSTPPFLNFLSEVYLIFCMMGYSSTMLMLFPIGSLLGAIFCIGLFSYTQHGKSHNSIMSVSLLAPLEYHLLVMHLYPLLGLFAVVPSSLVYC